MMTPTILNRIVTELIDEIVDRNEPTAVRSVVNLVLTRFPLDESADPDGFYALCALAHTKETVSAVLRKRLTARPQQQVGFSFAALQPAYLQEHEGEPIIVPMRAMTMTQWMRTGLLHKKQAAGHDAHAQDILRLLAMQFGWVGDWDDVERYLAETAAA